MGIKFFCSSDSYDTVQVPTTTISDLINSAQNKPLKGINHIDESSVLPKSDNYIILEAYQYGKNLVIKIKYLDCVNYEGEKILLYKKTNIKDLLDQKHIDPHFSENKNFKSPFARFVPNDEGMKYAISLAKVI